MPLLTAGFNRISAVGNYEHDYVATAGLANCIALIGTNSINRNIAIAHYDTMHANLQDGLEATKKELTKLHRWFAHRTNTNTFYIGLGIVWARDHVYGTTLREACNAVFGGFPREVGDAIFFFHENGAFHMQATHPEARALDQESGWTHSGTEIPYRNLTPSGPSDCTIS